MRHPLMCTAHARTVRPAVRRGPVGILVSSMSCPWASEVVLGVAETLESRGHDMMLATGVPGAGLLRRLAYRPAAGAPAGRLAAGAPASRSAPGVLAGLVAVSPAEAVDTIAALRRWGLPVVLVDDRIHRATVPGAVTTNRDGGRAAALHLLSLGRVRPLVVTGPPGYWCARERLDGFTETYAAAGWPVPPERIVDGAFTFGGGRAAVERAVAGGGSFDAVFAHNDVSAAGVIQAVHAAGRAIPGDVSVIGFDDLPLAAQLDPPLTTVRQPLRAMGAAAAGALLAHLDGGSLPTGPATFPTDLVVRGSTAPG